MLVIAEFFEDEGGTVAETKGGAFIQAELDKLINQFKSDRDRHKKYALRLKVATDLCRDRDCAPGLAGGGISGSDEEFRFGPERRHHRRCGVRDLLRAAQALGKRDRSVLEIEGHPKRCRI